MKLRDLADFNFSFKLAKKLLCLYYRRGKVYSLPVGPIRGAKMIYDPAMNLHTILGLADLSILRALDSIFAEYPLTPGGTAVDLGANRGLYSLWLARTGRFEKVYGFEPNPRLVEQLRHNATTNYPDEIEIFAGACADKVGQMDLFLGESDSISSLVSGSQQLGVSVPTTSLDDYFLGSIRRPLPSFIKMDIEGGGVFALPGAVKCIAQGRPLLYLESHSGEEDREIAKVLTQFDYQALRLEDRKWVTHVDEIYPHPGGIWGYLIACPTENQASVAKALHVRATQWKRHAKAQPRIGVSCRSSVARR